MSKKSVTLKDFSVGQTAYLLDADRRGQYMYDIIECSVTKVGRKYVSTSYGRWDRQFMVPEYPVTSAPYLEEKVECGYPMLLFPLKETAAEYQELQCLRQRVGEATGYTSLKTYSLDQLRAVDRILSNPEYKDTET